MRCFLPFSFPQAYPLSISTPGKLAPSLRTDHGTSVTKARVSTHERHRSVPPAVQFGGARFPPQEGNCRYVQAAAAMRGPLIEKGLWCSKTRSRRPTTPCSMSAPKERIVCLAL